MQGDAMMTLQTDLFDFAYVPEWYRHLYDLKCMALPEAWQFKKPAVETKNFETPILERYIHTIFRKQAIEFNSESVEEKASKYFHVENECACFHTGLYTPRYKGIYGFFGRNKKMDSMLEWYFRGLNFNPEWPIRVNVEHILGDEENLERLPAKIRKAKNLPLLLETAVELARRKVVVEPGLVTAQGYMGRVQYLLPIYLTKMDKPDLAMTLTVMDGYYLGNTCLTLEMAYLNARAIAKPITPWLVELVK